MLVRPMCGDVFNGESTMRVVFGLCFLIGLCASANGAAGTHRNFRHAIVRPGQAILPNCITSGRVCIYRDNSVPGGLRTDHDDPPTYDDPSRFGGG